MGIFDWLFGKKKKDNSVAQQDFDKIMEDPNSHVDYNESEVNNEQEDRTDISSSELDETSLILINGETNILLKGKLNSLSNDVDDFNGDFESLKKFNKNNLVKTDGEWNFNYNGNLYKIHYDFSGLKDEIPEMNIFLFEISSKLETMQDEALDILYALKVFLPNEQFVLYKRWGLTENEYYDRAFLSPEKPIYHTYTQIHSLPNEENFDEGALEHRGEQMEDLAVVLKYTDFKKIIKNHKKGMLKL